MFTNDEEVLPEAPETPEEVADGEEDKTDWKAIAQRNAGIAKRNATRLEKLKKASEAKIESPADKTLKTEKKGFDYAEKAFLRSNDIKAEEYDFVQEVMASTGKSLDEVLEAKYFQAELKERREAKASKDAIPNGSKRSTGSARDTVEYWIAKGELPPYDQRELRHKVVKAKTELSRSKAKFTDRPIA